MKSIDVVVPCYNYGAFLRECVESVLSQSVSDLRVLIIDDASQDNTPDVAQELARADRRVTFVRHPKNAGHIATYNEGIDWCAAQLSMLLSADDYLLPGALGRAIDVFDRHPRLGLVFGNSKVLTANGRLTDQRCSALEGTGAATEVIGADQFIRLSKATNIVPTPTAVTSTEMVKGSGGYLASLPHTADMEMWWRLAVLGGVGFVHDFQAVYRRHDLNMSTAYSQDRHGLGDLRGRRDAVDYFFRAWGGRLEHAVALRADALRVLSMTAVGMAGDAVLASDDTAVRALCSFAEELNPAIRRSPQWQKLALKQLIGPRAWRALRTLATPWRLSA
ncbi:glycosyltransferase family 2 protein [Rivibacter subsaxonicus]|uniref:Glycosyl transferase family 2 n=1 Tax=Rivibacter subsaxonicus TaxID=457575 RepID=A0A4Q7VVV7_9BURK|nr:glycosyltransferase family A protein [Rivibacter subsaxonicus]RZU00791.1 glycosyl transferase family 2 [Rivibacter subsaxonicus]